MISGVAAAAVNGREAGACFGWVLVFCTFDFGLRHGWWLDFSAMGVQQFWFIAS